MENQGFAWANYEWYQHLNEDEQRTLFIVKHSDILNTINMALQKKIQMTDRIHTIVKDLDSCMSKVENSVHEVLYAKDPFVNPESYKSGDKLLKLNYLMCTKNKRALRDIEGSLFKIYTKKQHILFMNFPPLVRNQVLSDGKEYLMPRNRFFEIINVPKDNGNPKRYDLELLML
jgi:hypothetical protein